MTLPASGAISFNNINVELGAAGTTQASLGQASYRTLAGVPSGAISMSNFYGKANAFPFNIASNTTNANLRSLAVAAGWNQASNVIATINAGVTIYSTSTGTPALTINGSFPAGVSLINNGVILGMGGNGGNGANAYPWYSAGDSRNIGTAGTSGGLALSVSVAVSITNNNRIAGGGGGGGGGGAAHWSYGKAGESWAGGGGGGGGINFGSAGARGIGTGGSSPSNGTAGSAGTLTSNGGGGAGGNGSPTFGGAGGAGGSYGSSGSTGGNGTWTQSPGSGSAGQSGGAAGGAVAGNANITWVATGTRNGGIS